MLEVAVLSRSLYFVSSGLSTGAPIPPASLLFLEET